MAKHKEASGPVISYKAAMNLHYTWQDKQGQTHVERLQFLPLPIFRKVAHRVAETHPGALSALPQCNWTEFLAAESAFRRKSCPTYFTSYCLNEQMHDT
jgi:hypothetical protein